MGTVVAKECQSLSIAVIGHVIEATDLFDGKGRDWALFLLQLCKSLFHSIQGCLLLLGGISTQVGIPVFRRVGRLGHLLSLLDWRQKAWYPRTGSSRHLVGL